MSISIFRAWLFTIAALISTLLEQVNVVLQSNTHHSDIKPTQYLNSHSCIIIIPIFIRKEEKGRFDNRVINTARLGGELKCKGSHMFVMTVTIAGCFGYIADDKKRYVYNGWLCLCQGVRQNTDTPSTQGDVMCYNLAWAVINCCSPFAIVYKHVYVDEDEFAVRGF